MANEFDPYRKWLGIPPSEQPPNHYRLLGIPLYESDVDVISNAADRQMAHVRTFQSGKYSEDSQKLLNELSAARVVLLDSTKREAYDEELRAKLTQPDPAPTPAQTPAVAPGMTPVSPANASFPGMGYAMQPGMQPGMPFPPGSVPMTGVMPMPGTLPLQGSPVGGTPLGSTPVGMVPGGLPAGGMPTGSMPPIPPTVGGNVGATVGQTIPPTATGTGASSGQTPPPAPVPPAAPTQDLGLNVNLRSSAPSKTKNRAKKGNDTMLFVGGGAAIVGLLLFIFLMSQSGSSESPDTTGTAHVGDSGSTGEGFGSTAISPADVPTITPAVLPADGEIHFDPSKMQEATTTPADSESQKEDSDEGSESDGTTEGTTDGTTEGTTDGTTDGTADGVGDGDDVESAEEGSASEGASEETTLKKPKSKKSRKKSSKSSRSGTSGSEASDEEGEASEGDAGGNSGEDAGDSGSEGASNVPIPAVGEIGALGKGYTLRLPPKREKMLAFYGGLDTEEAVRDGLKWLAARQMNDGAWCFNHTYVRPGKTRPGANRCENPGFAEQNVRSATGLALIAFTGAGISAKDRASRGVVLDGIRFLQSAARYVTTRPLSTPQEIQAAYMREVSLAEGDKADFRAHAWGTIAVCEFYIATKDKRIQPFAQALTTHVLSQQNSDGGWPHTERGLTVDNILESKTSAHESSTIATLWNLIALRAAQEAGISIPSAAWDGAARCLKNKHKILLERYPKGLEFVSSADARLLEHIALGLQILEKPMERKETQILADRTLEFKAIEQVENNFIRTMFLRDLRHKQWDDWNKTILHEYLKAQHGKGEEKGSWFFFADGTSNSDGGRMYCTAMAILALESYYRQASTRPLTEVPYDPTDVEQSYPGDYKKDSAKVEAAKEEEPEEELEPVFDDFSL
ncbi:MAG: hypothetical protein Q4D38_09420 [Planctomycetia bacterium]|nr:hypothetical protein [Planctomycetia bacterium]